MNFIMNIPNVGEHSSVFVFMYRFFKYIIFILTSKESHAEKTDELFIKHIMKYWGVSKSIVSDRDIHFTSKFSREIFMLLESDLLFFTSFYS